jgi:hypothetical protein
MHAGVQFILPIALRAMGEETRDRVGFVPRAASTA